MAESLGMTIAIYGAAAAIVAGIDYGVGWAADGFYGSNDARQYARQSGYSNVHLDGVEHFAVGVRGCDKTDEVGYEFDATAPNGDDHIKILVCKGLLKGATLRDDS